MFVVISNLRDNTSIQDVSSVTKTQADKNSIPFMTAENKNWINMIMKVIYSIVI